MVRGVAQFGSAPALGAGGRRFESCRPDHFIAMTYRDGGLEMKYLVIFEKGQSGQWGAYVPDLPGCTAVGATKAEARDLISKSIRLWLATARAKGWEIPAASSSALKLAV